MQRPWWKPADESSRCRLTICSSAACLSGAILGVATSLAFTGAVSTGQPLVGALIFPVGLIIIVLLGLELVTGSFALLPLPWLDRDASGTGGHDQLGLGFLRQSDRQRRLWRAARDRADQHGRGRADRRRGAHRRHRGGKDDRLTQLRLRRPGDGFVKGILCNWMVCLAVVLAMATSSTIGKIAAAWMPIFMFFAQGFEHSVVNMFIIPTGMMMGAKVTFADWWLWNQIPVTLGNLVGGFVFTGLRAST